MITDPIPKCPPLLDEDGKEIPGTYNNWLPYLVITKAEDIVTEKDELMCPKCGERERHYTAKGNITAYCRECTNTMQRARYWQLKPKLPEGTCPTCKLREVLVVDGEIQGTCIICKRLEHRKRKNKLLRKSNGA